MPTMMVDGCFFLGFDLNREARKAHHMRVIIVDVAFFFVFIFEYLEWRILNICVFNQQVAHRKINDEHIYNHHPRMLQMGSLQGHGGRVLLQAKLRQFDF